MPFLHRIDPIALDLGTWNLPLLGSVHPQVHWYGVMYLLGFIVAWWLGRRRVRAGRLPGVDDNGFGDLMFYAMLGVVLGGRVGYILFYDFGAFIANPLMIFKVWEGGMSFHGGLFGFGEPGFYFGGVALLLLLVLHLTEKELPLQLLARKILHVLDQISVGLHEVVELVVDFGVDFVLASQFVFLFG